MKGFYVYCIRSKLANILPAKAEGIEFGGKISVIPFKDIEAVVSDIDLFQFNEKKIEDKLQEDIKWAERNVQRHHGIVAEAYKTEMVIPMKFGTILKTKKSLEAMLKKHYRKFKRLLVGLMGQQEWGVKIYLEYEKFVEFLKKENKEVKKMEESKSAMSEGAQWYADKKIDKLITEKSEEEIEKQLQRIAKRLEDCCEQMVLCDLLPKEVTTEMSKDNIFNAACLIDNSKFDYFKKMLQETRKECDQIGATLVATGPWPPYNFV
ncbi:MAG: GvpL/GvpF family gas vesicle protein [bacterium]|nr:GvpL/GvpF family gas vesicle protein [bacterium]